MHDKLKTRRCLSWTNVPSLCLELIHTSSGFQGEKSKGGVKENPASLFNRAICLKTCKIQINLLYELCSELDSAILLNWWFYRTRRNSFFGRWPEVCRCSKSVSRSKVFSLFRLSSLPSVLKNFYKNFYKSSLWCLLVDIITVALMSDAPPPHFTIGCCWYCFNFRKRLTSLPTYAIVFHWTKTMDSLMMNGFITRPFNWLSV